MVSRPRCPPPPLPRVTMAVGAPSLLRGPHGEDPGGGRHLRDRQEVAQVVEGERWGPPRSLSLGLRAPFPSLFLPPAEEGLPGRAWGHAGPGGHRRLPGQGQACRHLRGLPAGLLRRGERGVPEHLQGDPWGHPWAWGRRRGPSRTLPCPPMQIGTGFTEESLEKHYGFLKVDLLEKRRLGGERWAGS